MTRRALLLAAAAGPPRMYWADSSRGRPFSKDPSVIRFGDRYLLYYSLPPYGDKRPDDGWAIGIASSRNLVDWKKEGEVLPAQECDRKGLCAPQALVIGGRVHLLYQTYGNREKDAICHAVSEDGLRFERNATNPIFRPTGGWNCGRAIDAEVVAFGGRRLLYAATRDPSYKVQMLVAAEAPLDAGFDRGVWRQTGGGPVLRPELPWERNCIEAPSAVVRDGRLYLFYAGGYNNEPQQIGCAMSTDGVRFERLSPEPFLANGKPGEWNESESGHPAAFVDRDGSTYLFFQGNNDRGRTWHLSWARVEWAGGRPRLAR